MKIKSKTDLILFVNNWINIISLFLATGAVPAVVLLLSGGFRIILSELTTRCVLLI